MSIYDDTQERVILLLVVGVFVFCLCCRLSGKMNGMDDVQNFIEDEVLLVPLAVLFVIASRRLAVPFVAAKIKTSKSFPVFC
jgi:uncharacterized membrane protein YhdT